jgi:PAS domain S-box-containing protein
MAKSKFLSKLNNFGRKLQGKKPLNGNTNSITKSSAGNKEQELEMLRAAVSQATEGIIVVDAQQFYFVNEAFAKMHGYTKADFIGKQISFLHKPEDAELLKNIIKEIEKNGFWEGETEHVRKDGSVFLTNMAVTAVKNEEGKPIRKIAICKDLTEQKRQEQEKRKMQNHLIQIQKLESIAALAKGIAYDFNDIFSSIKCTIDLMMLDIRDDSRSYKDMKEIKNTLTKGTSLLNQLITFSAGQPKNLETLNINDLIDDIKNILKSSLEDDIKIKTALAAGLYHANIDRASFDQVIMNLVNNAKDVMPEGGSITLKTENVSFTQEEAQKVLGAKRGQFVCLTISDTGIGMKKETLSRIFEPFYSTKNGKLGIGLSVVYGVVRQHNGWISVESFLGRGTSFKIYLPRALESKKQVKEEAFYPEMFRGNNEKVLIIEDDIAVRNVLKRILESNGYKVIDTGSAQEAQFVFNDEKGKFDLLLCDINLYEKDGVSLAKELLVLNPKIKVLLTSGYPQTKLIWSEITAKGYSFLQKPFGLSDVLKAIRKALN